MVYDCSLCLPLYPRRLRAASGVERILKNGSVSDEPLKESRVTYVMSNNGSSGRTFLNSALTNAKATLCHEFHELRMNSKILVYVLKHVHLNARGDVKIDHTASSLHDAGRYSLRIGAFHTSLFKGPFEVDGSDLENIEILILLQPIETDFGIAFGAI
jgi:hypothetical protein